jgi:hypothetical protein
MAIMQGSKFDGMRRDMKDRINLLIKFLVLGSGLTLSACSVTGPIADEINPFGNGNQSSESFGGERNTGAILGNGGGAKSAEAARHALEVMGTYRKALPPQPNYPVIQPAEMRLMWIPDHLNAIGDLVPAHYYYLRVLPDRPAVTDAFDIESQLDLSSQGSGAVGGGSNLGTGGAGGATPWVYKETK